jgi:hypothetical protein
VIKKTSAEESAQKASLIFENTEDTLTYLGDSFAPTMLFSNGDTFEINRVIQAIDQPGTGQGSLIVAADPPTPPAGWNDQVVEASYQWDNDGGDESPQLRGLTGLMVEDTHFFNDTPAPGYAPYTYPHPLRGVSGGTWNIGTLIIGAP